MNLAMGMRLLLLVLALVLSAHSQAAMRQYDQYEVNGHPGYLSAWSVIGPLDKVLLLVPGFDTENDSMPMDKLVGDFGAVTWFMGLGGWDVIYFDYVDGAMDLKHNADNLAHFIAYLDSQAGADYHLAVVGGSMGGIVARTMFVQENDHLGVDTYVSIDAPHWGVYLSAWVEDLANLAIDYEAAHQMHHDDPAYEEHYGWLRAVEATADFQERVNKPMNTCAIALSDGSDGYWKVSWDDKLLHNKYYPVSSYIEYSGLRSTYMPYHSTVYLDSPATDRRHWLGYDWYRYRTQQSSYFDQTVANPRDEHAAPRYAVVQALKFILQHEGGQ